MKRRKWEKKRRQKKRREEKRRWEQTNGKWMIFKYDRFMEICKKAFSRRKRRKLREYVDRGE